MLYCIIGFAAIHFFEHTIVGHLHFGEETHSDAMIAKGASDFQVKKYLTDRYGEFILYRPAVNLRTYLLWFGPLLLLAIGLIALYRFTRRAQAVAAPAVDEAALRKLLDDQAR